MNHPSDFDEWTGRSQGDGQDAWGRGDGTGSIADVWGEASEPVPYRASRRPDWFAPAIVIVLAMMAFAIAWLVTRGHDRTDRAATPSVTTQRTSTPSSTSTDAGATAPTDSSAPTSTRSSTSTPPSATSSASFPPDAVATCGNGQAVPTSSVRLAPGTTSTCPYVAETVTAVNDHLTRDAEATLFTIEPWSAALGHVVPLTCTRQNHLSYCTGGSNVRLWVSDTVN